MIKKTNYKKIYFVVAWALAIGWMALIFYLSSQVSYQSNNLSKGVAKNIVEIINKLLPNAAIDARTFNNILRKFAHFSSYMVLSILVQNALEKSGFSKRLSFIYTITICVLYAISDELHQAFVPGRGPQFTDILIDSLGVIAGTLTFRVWSQFDNKLNT